MGKRKDIISKSIRWGLAHAAPNSSRVHLERLNRNFAQSIPDDSLVLDAAAGDQPYRHLFNHCRYETTDHEKSNRPYGETTFVCDLASIPVENERYDAVVFNQGLEHMPHPKEVLEELHRVLKLGGKILITAPFFYEEHEQPHDYFRYTQFAYRQMLPATGFEIESIDWLEGYLGTVAYQLDTAARHLPSGIIFAALRVAFALIAIVFYRLDARKAYTTSGFPKNYAVLAKRPDKIEQN